MKRILCAIAIVLSLLLSANSSTYAQSSLPPEVQADMLKTEIVNDLRREDVNAALAAFDKYHALKVPFPTPLRFLEAKAASMAGDPVRAFKALEAFLKETPREGKQYSEALALYPQYEEAAKPALAVKQRAAEERASSKAAAKAQAEAKERAIAKAACDINPACNVVDLGDGVLKQGVTGLEWTQSDNGKKISWIEARDFCWAKGRGWRLPSEVELGSLIDEEGALQNSCIPSDASYDCPISPLFKLTGSSVYASELNGSVNQMFDLRRHTKNRSDSSYEESIRVPFYTTLCVRASTQKGVAEAEEAKQVAKAAKQAACENNDACNMMDEGGGVVRQVNTGLLWTQPSSGEMNWKAAKTWCESRGNVWRLPAVSELKSLNNKGDRDGVNRMDDPTCGEDVCNVSPLFKFVGGMPSFWSSEWDGIFSAFMVTPEVALDHSLSRSADAFVMCVRPI